MRSRSSHSRKSPLKPMLSAIWRPEDDAWLDLLAGLDCSFAGFADTTFKIEVSVYLHYTQKLGSTLTAFLCIPAHQSRLGDNVTLHCGVDDVTFRFWRQTYARVERV